MNKLYITLLCCAATLTAGAQATFDVLKMSQTELSGTSRYMSMAGAFGAVGGDITTIGQNPAGVGVYRSSDIGVTMNLNFKSSKTPSDKLTDTKFAFNSIGYVGSMKVDSKVLRYFNWGFSFNRVNDFHRRYTGRYNTDYSLTEKIASNLNSGYWNESDLSYTEGENVYYSSNAPWLGILAYQSYLVNPTNSDGTGFAGLGGSGTAGFTVDEKGHTDEYNITLGGNFINKIYWGLNFGITDLDFDSYQFYGEDMRNADIYNYQTGVGTTKGYGGFGLESYQLTKGTGYNFKMGVIVKPINELRIGAAFHTPTYYDMKDVYKVYSDFTLQAEGAYDDDVLSGGTETGEEGYYDEYRYTIKTPWRFIGSVAVVPNSKGMLSLDYEYVGANTMRCGDEGGHNYDDTEYNIKDQLQASHIVRVGGEYRVSPNVSLRAGYSYQTSPVRDEIKGKSADVDVVSSNYAYQYDKSNQYITAGLGYHYKNFYLDAAYIHQDRKMQYHAFPTEQGEEVKENNNKVTLTLGFRF